MDSIKGRGKLVVVDGTDGTGKETQTRLLKEACRKAGKTAARISFPRYSTPTGKQVRAYLSGKFGDPIKLSPVASAMLYAMDRLCAKELIEQKLAENDLVVLDRFVPANQAYQGAKINKAHQRTDFWNWSEQLEYGTFLKFMG